MTALELILAAAGASSTSGPPWSTRNGVMPVSSAWSGITYGNGLFLVMSVAGNTIAATSPDGISWTAQTMPSSPNSWVTCAYGAGVFVALTLTGTTAASSPDGVTWTIRSLPFSLTWSSVTFANGIFVALGNNSASGATSTDGITWSPITLPVSGNWTGIAYGNGTFVSVSFNSTDAIISADGATWTRHAMPFSQRWNGIAYGNGMFVTLGGLFSARSAISVDGVNWRSTPIETNTYKCITFGNGLFAASANASGTSIITQYTSVDGLTWASYPTTIAGSVPKMAYGNNTIVGAVTNSATALTSP